MLHLYKGQDNNLIFTIYELSVLASPKYLFIFTGANDKIVKFVATNIVNHSNRYQTMIVLDKVFKNYDSGTWRYEVYEQTSATNLDPLLSSNMVESGFMYLHDATTCVPDEYTDQCNEFKTYKGE